MIRSWPVRYGIAVLAVGQVLLIKLLLAPQIGKETPFLLFFTAVMVSAGYGGIGPGLLATALAALASNYFFQSPPQALSLGLDEVTKIVVFGLEGLLMTSVIVALNTARERAEESALKAQKHQEALYKSEESYRLLVEGVRDYAFFMLNPDGQVISWNAGAEHIYGYQKSEVIGRHISIFYTREDRQEKLPAYGLGIASQEGYSEGTGWRIRKDGTRFWADAVITALKDQTGNLQAFSKVTRDITERKQLEDALRQRAEKLEQVNRIKDEFLATLSHELRTPLNAVLGWSQLLRTRKLKEDRVARGLETIERNAKSQIQLIEDLLDVSSIIKGKLRLDIRNTNLVPVVEAAIATAHPAADAKAINLRFLIANFELGSEGSELETHNQEHQHQPKFCVMGDPDRLQQIVWNLLSNAVKFTPMGGRVEIRLLAAREKHSRVSALTETNSSTHSSYAQIQVSDTGKGISPDFMPYVFDRFRQADGTSTRLHEGLGLGLAIARHLIELHGGTIQADSRGEGQGATFTVSLPCLTIDSSKVGIAQDTYEE